MEELDLNELVNYYIKRIPVLILSTILAVLLGFVYIKYYQVPMYHGKTTIILIQNNNESGNKSTINETVSQLNVNEKLVTTYSEIIKSRRVLEQVKEKLNLKETIESLNNSIEVSSVSETAIIEITVSHEDAKKAVKIANELAEVFKVEITNLYNLENVSIIDEAIVEKEPYNVNIPKQIIIYIALGISISCVIIFVMYYFDNSIKNKREIESRLNIAVVGEVPLSRRLMREQALIEKKKRGENE